MRAMLRIVTGLPIAAFFTSRYHLTSAEGAA